MAPYTGYRLMWMMVMFDLPVSTPDERQLATGFRNALLNEGFEMSQFSVYLRFCGDRSHTEAFIRKIKLAAPPDGKISILFFTDKQFSEIINIHNQSYTRPPEKPGQFTLL